MLPGIIIEAGSVSLCWPARLVAYIRIISDYRDLQSIAPTDECEKYSNVMQTWTQYAFGRFAGLAAAEGASLA